jgi:16S rRNA processing protein RimM
MADKPQFLIAAKILRPHGVRGDFVIQIITDFPNRLQQVEKVYLTRDPEKRGKPFPVVIARPHQGNHWLLHLDGIETRNDSEPYRNAYVMIALTEAVPLDEDEVYLFQVMGAEVHTTDGQVLGMVVDFIETGANDVYVVNGGTYGEILIPAIPDVVLNIDPDAKTMLVQLMDGLLPEPKAESPGSEDEAEDEASDAE